MRTLHPGLRVTTIGASLAFYSAIGYEEVGTVRGTTLGDLTLIKLAGDEFAAIWSSEIVDLGHLIAYS
jgi:lactoylglutathione lyase